MRTVLTSLIIVLKFATTQAQIHPNMAFSGYGGYSSLYENGKQGKLNQMLKLKSWYFEIKDNVITVGLKLKDGGEGTAFTGEISKTRLVNHKVRYVFDDLSMEGITEVEIEVDRFKKSVSIYIYYPNKSYHQQYYVPTLI